MEEGEMEGDRGMVREVEGVWNLRGMGMLNCMRTSIEMSVCVLVLVVVLVVVLVWMALTVWVVVGVLVVATVMVQGILV